MRHCWIGVFITGSVVAILLSLPPSKVLPRQYPHQLAHHTRHNFVYFNKVLVGNFFEIYLKTQLSTSRLSRPLTFYQFFPLSHSLLRIFFFNKSTLYLGVFQSPWQSPISSLAHFNFPNRRYLFINMLYKDFNAL